MGGACLNAYPPAKMKGKTMEKEILCDVLDSYLEFIDIMEKTLTKANLPAKYGYMATMLINQRREAWKPVRDKLREGNDGVQV